MPTYRQPHEDEMDRLRAENERLRAERTCTLSELWSKQQIEIERLRAAIDGVKLELEAERHAHRKDNEYLVAENERLRAALLWIDRCDPETIAAAEEKFGFKLNQNRAKFRKGAS